MSEIRRRRRPETRKGRPTLTRELIARQALELAGAEGFPAVTMRRLADELSVSVRALYNYVEDRQEVVELATQLLLSQWQIPELHPDRWEGGVRDYCHQMRELYRSYPRALLVSLDEQIRADAVPPARMHNPDALIGLLLAIGLSPSEAYRAHVELAVKMFGFALLVDYRANNAIAEAPEWLGAHDVPRLAEATGAGSSPDELFEYLVDTLILSIHTALAKHSN